MADLTHPADEVPGGLWRSALRSAVCRRCGMLHDASEVRIVSLHCRSCRLWQEDPPAALRLDDPLGLGLAGLAARVAEWLGWDHLRYRGPDAVESCAWGWLHEQGWTGRLREGGPAISIRWLASYLALTDRLAAAAGLTLAPGTVAIIRREDDCYLPGIWVMEGLAQTGDRDPWLLTLPPNGQHQHDDPLTALRAALAALEER